MFLSHFYWRFGYQNVGIKNASERTRKKNMQEKEGEKMEKKGSETTHSVIRP